ncbi:hypothetical protein K1719_019955 [Acacia pycnantha]|nr:hypothetical protein K1719_019955 [Acacia pycnantha]
MLIHQKAVTLGLQHDVAFFGSYLLSMSAKCNELECAIQLFDEMPEKDVACWNSVISCYYQIGKFEEALNFFEVIRRCGFAPDSVTITTAISSCARLLDLDKGREIHKELTWN